MIDCLWYIYYNIFVKIDFVIWEKIYTNMKDRRRRAFAWILTFALLISAREFTWATEVTDVTESTETSTETETATETTTETPSESTTDPMDEAAYEAKLKEAGFTDIKFYGDWDLSPVTDESDMIVAILS